MDIPSFLQTVVTTPEGWFNLAVGHANGNGVWHQEWYEWPHQINEIVDRAQNAAKESDVYFTAHLFEAKSATKQNVLPSRTIQADLDYAQLVDINQPSILVETSPTRHQGFWILKDSLEPSTLEAISKQLTYSIPDADRTGWPLGHKMRVPFTLNHKYSTGPKPVKIVSAELNQYSKLNIPNIEFELELEEIPDASSWIPQTLEDIGPRQLWLQIKSNLPRRIQAQYDIKQNDRSAALWALMLSLFRAGLSRDQVFWIAQSSANNKFKDNRYHSDLDLAKDILRAEQAIKRGDNTEDIRAKIAEARRLPGLASDRKAFISALVQQSLDQSGSFVATTDGQEWYIRNDTGRPIQLTKSSDYLNSLLDIRFGLNATEAEQRYSINYLIATTKERGRKGQLASLTYYEKNSNSVLLHTGKREVLRITSTGITSSSNGQYGVVFPWRHNEDPFEPDVKNPLSLDTLFEGCFDNLNEMPSEEALALVKAWLYFLFFRNDATGRPILSLFGQPGSGKSTLFRRIYTFLYGFGKSVNSITTADDFDHAVANDPLVVFDNVDTWVNWLPDKLALSASTSDLVKRKLYTDNDTVTLKRQALVGITAHNPKFRREDIVDRLVILSFHRLKEFKPETELLTSIALNRDSLWGAIINDIQTILRTPQPLEVELPRFRVSDFARIGVWISRALGFEKDFVNALNRNIKEQTAYNLEEEDILVDVVKMWASRKDHDGERYWTTGQLWTQWSEYSRDQINFIKTYKNAVTLGKKLWTLQETLNSVINIDYEFDDTGGRRWKFSPK